MKVATAVALSFGAKALAGSTHTYSSGFGTCSSSACHSSTGLGGSVKSSAAAASGTATWESWSADPTKTSSTSNTAGPAKNVPSGTTWESWSADPATASGSTWGTWESATSVTVSTSTTTTVTVKAAVATTCGACASYASNGDSWGFPSCADGAEASGVYNGWGTETAKADGTASGFLSTVPTQWATTVSQVTKSWSVWPTGTSSPNTTVQPIPADNNCNSPSNRGSWCDGLSINTDQDTTWPNTGAVCEYDFTISNIEWDYDGTPRPALAVNGQIPGPAIECNWGDTVKITVHNALTSNATTIHWHGIRQLNTNDQDGVPGVTECAVAPGSSRTYTWVATSYGSSWYHSHFVTQFADGVQGPIIIKGPTSANYDVDLGTVFIGDLFNVTAAQEYDIISHTGPLGTSNYILNGHNTKPDLSAGTHSLWEIEAGKKYLFRFVNSAAQSGWRVGIDSHTLTVIAADFVPITPYTTDFLDISIGQRYDVIIEANQAVASYFLRAATQGACPSTCDNTAFGLANGIVQYKGASNALPTSTPSFGPGDVAGICQDEPLASLVPVVTKTAGSPAIFSAQASVLPVESPNAVATSDDGVVFRWYLNGNTMDINPATPTLEQLAKAGNGSWASAANSTFSETDNVAIISQAANQWVYFVIQNEFFAPHPMHLHGHDFAVLGQGVGPFTPGLVSSLNFASPPRRDSVMLAGQGYTVVGFVADNPGAWLLHCHIAWHASGGLSLQFLERPADIPAAKYALSDSFQSECSSYASFAATAPFQLSQGDSGLKVRREELAGYSPDIVRRTEKSSKRYLAHNLKRGLGDNHHQHGHY